MSVPTNKIQNAYDEWAEIYDTNENKTRDLNYRCIRQQQLDLVNKKVLGSIYQKKCLPKLGCV
ncbi:hypothetical protein LQ318_15340 [Aliifodinibius salicampi]|uniref:Uncharacterized protein n=1 Tax=Fodinibius salicampi TaxID=1920655 RepID=A0ABT3Q2G4_9BACT|nr:hypothetical protein [Fodinibius salicampi]MCW9714281.1 hypothetical protein [Fodinibius salicampi]